ELWENRALIGGGLVAFTHGVWCLVAILVVRDPFAELASCTLTIALTVGMVARNFGLDRMLTLQILFLSVPLWIAMILRGDIYHQLLAAFIVVLLISFRKLAGDVRALLLSAVHGRAEVSRLAAELDMAITTLEHGLCLLDEKGAVSVANDRALRLFNMMGVSNLIGTPLSTVLDQLAAAETLPRSATDRLMEMVGRNVSGKVVLNLPQGGYYEVTVSSRDDRCVLLFEDISERVAAEERISYMARHDTLTGLPNRTCFGELVGADLDARNIGSGEARNVSLMIIDIDDFKHVNDSYGHVVGDSLLMEVASRLQKALPESALLARLGGDEFVVYLDRVASEEDLRANSRRILEAFHAPFRLKGLTLTISISLGIVVSASPQHQLDDLMTRADLALYAAKADGKGKCQVFHAKMDTDYHYRQRLKTDLKDAVQNNGLSLAFQPLLDIGSRKVVSCEALARWEHPELGSIPPSVFIPMAEEAGLISDITAWVLAEATRQCALWPGEIGVAVNVSARDFRGIDLVEVVDDALTQSGLARSRLEIEVTETAVIEDPDVAKTVLSGLAAQGVGIALDDFGTGYSSLSYLSALPFTKLKIDRSFVNDISSNERALRLLINLARLGRDLDLTVVAEGVETEEQLSIMQDQTQVQQVQGYFFSRPLPTRDIAELITRLNAPYVARKAGQKLRHG
ncbi:MAG: EAL domain-containing protein, partial [Phyllobacteriaceae bacterium]|nr:EAL domain-containing protein [Phyllobacteriaceae bacterium]